MNWCFDTSALIEPWVRHYPPDLFSPVWAKLEKLAEDGIIVAPLDVKHELERQSDGLTEWARAQSRFFIEADRDVLEKIAEVVNDHPGFLKIDSTKSGADPVVVALAEVNRIAVVSYETAAKKGAAPKIPNVCAARDIAMSSFVEVLRQTKFSL